jgi:ribosomal protein S18 acetylase RimI-like enzyme
MPDLEDTDPKPSKGSETTSLAGQFLWSAAYAAIQRPITGLAQIKDHVCHSNSAADWSVIKPPEQAPFGTSAWHAQTLGDAAGSLVPLLLVNKGVKTMTGVANEAALYNCRSAVGFTLKEAAITGFVADALFKPTVGKSGNFIDDRLQQGAAGAASFCSLAAGSLALTEISYSSFARKSALSGILRNPVVSGVVAGMPSGVLSAELESISAHHRPATMEEVAKSVYASAFTGAAFGAKHWMFGERPPALKELAPDKITGNLRETWATKQDVQDLARMTVLGLEFIIPEFDHSAKIGYWDARIAAGIAKKQDHYRIIRDSDGNACAMAAMRPINDASVPSYLLFNVYVHKQYRDMGLGRQLMNTMLDEARAAGVQRVDLTVSNPVARKLYESAGFTETKKYSQEEAADFFRLPSNMMCYAPSTSVAMQLDLKAQAKATPATR